MKFYLTRIALIIFPLVMGILFIVFGFHNHSLGKASESWPSVQGKLTGESISKHKKKVMVFYEYQVLQNKYKNSRVNFQDDRASKKKIRAQYQAGDTIKVYYNPENPEQSVLQPGATITSLLLKILAGFFCFGLTGVFLMLRKR